MIRSSVLSHALKAAPKTISQPINLYDIPCKIQETSWSPNTAKARYCLRYKGLPFKTTWVEYPDIEAQLRGIGARPTGINKDGSGLYTLPVIEDPSTRAVISDSFAIAEYLDENYPSAAALFPGDTKALIKAFDSASMNLISFTTKMMSVKASGILNPVSAMHYVRTREHRHGLKWKDFLPAGQERREIWNDLETSFGVLDHWYAKSTGKWILGDTVSYADILTASRINWFRVLLEQEQWTEMSSWHGGRWKAILEEFEEL
ncbi:hypothetical protein SERLA73DRAFT_188903 [Serpula lacrymans var. lacrymans S7.3]|uniref:GST N-terminal domain-containing protein n=2 Tax=Serpula lacrymans var. lacrymans TaxID=341189 RepID=F8QCD1_SERL3|nr:uncharacterized protein SERLADRAFT_479512 [Serpula lacrymans var. lacrymans S7.9]EGN93796.1 hypothetical protein SERLA73DRAFT_188903 [Serpula lacrymans var. lacrymans S7.3]EGO19167.1 hypothetical protein SERLADRAFT_479512 [Serpula lacrymans var. lacrymans S7.9]